ncbi:MAG: CCA tRNA nucleotidyltransferase [Microbacteriaceae bacterium]
MESVANALARLASIAGSSPVLELSRAFAGAGRELALVGGPVRDAFLGRTAIDLDFATDATPDQTLEIIAPLASAHWDIGRAFGTIGARINGEQVEITTYRSDDYDAASRKPEVSFGASLEGDLLRRDFTINAMAIRLPALVLVDPANGIEDLFDQLLRTPISPEVSFGDDPLRMMRAARFTSQLGFLVDDDLVRAMRQMAERLSIISAERIRDELVKLLAGADAARGVRLLVETGLAGQFLPELPALRLESDEHHRHKDVYEHSLRVLEQSITLEQQRRPGAPPDVTARLAALLHDIGKPVTRRFEPGGAVSFHHHDVVGAKLAAKRLRALRFDNDTVGAVRRLIELHLRFFGYTDAAWTDSAVRRYVRDAGEQLDRLHILTRADVTTRNQRKANRLARAYDELETRIDQLAEQEQLDATRPELDGEQIMAILGLNPSPAVGEAYRFLLELRLDEGPIGEAAAAERLRAWWSRR